LTVEAGSRLVKEQKKLRLGRQLHTNGKTFTLLDVETC
jgi:hypothetical protein